MREEMDQLFGDGLGATVVTTVASRAEGAQKFGIDGWDDPQARAVLARLRQRAAEAGVELEPLILQGEGEVVGAIRRSQAMDAVVRDFSRRHGPGAQVLAIGVGLCNRASRLAEVPVRWVGSDRAAVINLRREMIDDDAVELRVGDGAARAVLETLDSALPTLVLVEGVLMYLTEAEVAQMLRDLREYFALVEVCADIFDTDTQGDADGRSTELTKSTGTRYTFAVAGAAGLAALAPGWRVRGEIDVMSQVNPAFAQMVQGYAAAHDGRLMYAVAHIESERR